MSPFHSCTDSASLFPPYQNLPFDCIHAILSYHIFHISNRTSLTWNHNDWAFVSQHATCWCFIRERIQSIQGSGVKAILEKIQRRLQHGRPPIEYLNLSAIQGITDDVFPFLSDHITELNLDFSNTRSVESLFAFKSQWNASSLFAAIGETIRKLFLRGCSLEGVSDHDLKHLKVIRELSLVDCFGTGNLTDGSMIHLRGIRNLHMGSCHPLQSNLSDEGIRNLLEKQKENREWKDSRPILSLNVREFSQLSAAILPLMEGIQSLDISDCRGIRLNDYALSCLRGIKRLIASGHTELTDESLKHLEGVQELDISNCDQITGEGFRYLTGSLKVLRASDCPRLSTLAYLEGIEELSIFHTEQFGHVLVHLTDADYSHLVGIRSLNMRGRKYDFITPKILHYFDGIEELNMDHCSQIIVQPGDKSPKRLLEKIKNLSVRGTDFKRLLEWTFAK